MGQTNWCSMPSLPSERPYSAAARFRRPRGSGPALSRQRVKQLLDNDNWDWADLQTGLSWRVVQRYRADKAVLLSAPGEVSRLVTYRMLGKYFALDEGAEG